MTSRDFCYWLQGFFELNPPGNVREMNETQTAIVRAHLDLVFKHEIDPSMGPPEHQKKLNEVHGPEVFQPKPPKPEPAWSPGSSSAGPLIRC